MDKTHYADYDTLARIAELEAENARMKEPCDFAWRNARTIDAVRMEAEKKLLAAQLRINELREALEDVALRVAKESKLNEFMWLDESIETFTDEVVAVTDFARRLVAALGAAEPVAWLNKKIPHMAVLTKPDDGGGWFPVYAAPRITLDLSSAPPQLPQREGWQWVPVAWATELKDGEIGFWPTREEACSYCEDGVFPTPLYAAHKPEDVK